MNLLKIWVHPFCCNKEVRNGIIILLNKLVIDKRII